MNEIEPDEEAGSEPELEETPLGGLSGGIDVFDFRRPDRIPKSQIRAIQMMHENFVRSAVSSLSAYLRTYLSMNLVSVDQLSFAQFLEKLPASTCIACLGLQPYEGTALLEISPALVFPILEILLGGTGKVAAGIEREITEIEQSLMDGLFRIVVKDLAEAWKSVTTIHFSIQSVNTEPQFLQMMAPNEAILVTSIEMHLGEAVGYMNIAMPSLLIKTLRQKFDHQHSTRKSEATPEEQARVLELIKPARAEVDARLLNQQIQARDLLSLKTGDVLTFDMPIEAPIDLAFNGYRLFRGQIVSVGSKRGFTVNGPATN